VPTTDKRRCPAGHAYDEVNTYFYADSRNGRLRYRCRRCHRERQRARDVKRRGYV